MEYIIKKFNELSVDELYHILRERIDVFVVEQNCPYRECDNKDMDSFHVMIKDGDKIGAYLRIIPSKDDEMIIGRVLVTKEYRNRGLASKIMKKAMEFIGNKSIRISAQEYLIDFYKGLGFNPISQVYLEDGIPHIDMICK
ncbi:GNAT family N-acetyltransferase [Anaeromicrobium sediminis]|uniref:GNAT family N-acetyltransferase n=1 Tax=Anaeromicrobium sediminis TaxID=1478221 RepID=A0A267MEU6_9FIRM|nr:GNAT family N-acetyltransferase [Anaeromicrobium sediminis]PAB57405.1 GNAT family N-acetyltransferase [Anaeromicrobium sediminis]